MMGTYIFWFVLIVFAVVSGLLLTIFLGVNMTRRQQIKEALKKAAQKIGGYISTHVDEEERKRLLEIIEDNRVTRAELIEAIKMMLSPNKPKPKAAAAATTYQEPTSGTEPHKA